MPNPFDADTVDLDEPAQLRLRVALQYRQPFKPRCAMSIADDKMFMSSGISRSDMCTRGRSILFLKPKGLGGFNWRMLLVHAE